MIPKALRRSAEFFARQLSLALDDMTGKKALRDATTKKEKTTKPTLKEAKMQLQQALRALDRATRGGEAAACAALKEITERFFGKQFLNKLKTCHTM